MKLPVTSDDVVAIRKKLGINQNQFWAKLSVTQSGGSRYENDRNIAAPVQHLIIIAYGTQAESDKLVASLRNGKAPK